jgi:anti-anti-sigma factor
MTNVTEVSHDEFLLVEVDGVLVVTFHGPNVPFHSRDPLLALVGEDRHRDLVLNFENVRVITSAPIGILVALRTKAASIGGSVKLCRLDPIMLQIMQASHMHGFFDNFDEEEDAIDSFWDE